MPFQQHALAAREESQNDTEYWVREFAELPAPLDLPTDRPRPLARSGKAGMARRAVNAATYQSLERLAGQQKTTLVVLLMASIDALLYRLTGQADVVIGLGVAGQAMTGQNCLVGHCLNMLPLRMRLQPDASFKANLTAVRKSLLDAYDHHRCTVGGLLQHISVPRNPGRSPLVEVVFNVLIAIRARWSSAAPSSRAS